jgi:hypothetical protein
MIIRPPFQTKIKYHHSNQKMFYDHLVLLLQQMHIRPLYFPYS